MRDRCWKTMRVRRDLQGLALQSIAGGNSSTILSVAATGHAFSAGPPILRCASIIRDANSQMRRSPLWMTSRHLRLVSTDAQNLLKPRLQTPQHIFLSQATLQQLTYVYAFSDWIYPPRGVTLSRWVRITVSTCNMVYRNTIGWYPTGHHGRTRILFQQPHRSEGIPC